MPRRLTLPAAFLLLAAGGTAGYLVGLSSRGREAAPIEIHQVHGGPRGFTNPLLDCGTFTPGPEIRSFKGEMEDLVQGLKRDGYASRISIYYRDLENGPWLGLREKVPFLMASLIKVPVVIACLLQAQHDPSFLKRRIRFLGMAKEYEDQYFPPREVLVAGKEYTVEDLIRRTASYSDNGSALLLKGAVDKGILERVYLDLGIEVGQAGNLEPTISAKDFGGFFRILYNATYLDREMSERALSLFAGSAFTAGLEAGVPPGITVAHKFGETGYLLQGRARRQLHDCGIVYHPDRPYLLCVMTEGDDFERMAGAIAAVSRMVYGKVEERGKEPPFTPDFPPALP